MLACIKQAAAIVNCELGLLDKETNSYSLSKFQLFLFTAVFVFGYIYLFLCRWLVQWNLVAMKHRSRDCWR